MIFFQFLCPYGRHPPPHHHNQSPEPTQPIHQPTPRVIETRRGRCGEYSRLFFKAAEALRYRARWVVDWEVGAVAGLYIYGALLRGWLVYVCT